MKKLNLAFKQIVLVFVLQFLITMYFTHFEELRFLEQLIVGVLFWYFTNAVFYWFVSMLTPRIPETLYIHKTGLSASLGAVLSIVAYNFIF